MHFKIDTAPFTVTGERKLTLADQPNAIDDLYKDEDDYEELLEEYREEIDDLQVVVECRAPIGKRSRHFQRRSHPGDAVDDQGPVPLEERRPEPRHADDADHGADAAAHHVAGERLRR